MRWVGFVIVAAVSLVVAFVVLRRMLAASRSRERLRSLGEESGDDGEEWSRWNSWPRYRWLTPLVGLLCGTILALLGLPWAYVGTFAFLAFVLAIQAEATWAERRERKVERQLSSVLDMMIASVKAGASLTSALESARSVVRRPLQTELDVLVGRIRFGDSPQDALSDLAERLPLETIRLFAQALAVNWSIGGRLSDTLANVGKTVRDRAELTRRTQAMSTQARLSVVVIIGVTYFIAALMWRNDPARFTDFLASMVGQTAVATAVAAQGVGTLWVAKLSQPKF